MNLFHGSPVHPAPSWWGTPKYYTAPWGRYCRGLFVQELHRGLFFRWFWLPATWKHKIWVQNNFYDSNTFIGQRSLETMAVKYRHWETIPPRKSLLQQKRNASPVQDLLFRGGALSIEAKIVPLQSRKLIARLSPPSTKDLDFLLTIDVISCLMSFLLS